MNLKIISLFVFGIVLGGVGSHPIEATSYWNRMDGLTLERIALFVGAGHLIIYTIVSWEKLWPKVKSIFGTGGDGGHPTDHSPES